MQLSELNKGLFGYKKEQVHHYVDLLNTEFSERLSAAEAKYEERIAELEKQIAKLSEALEASKIENSKYRDSYRAIADSLLDAKMYADREKSETLMKEQKARAELDLIYENGRKEAQGYLELVTECRKKIASLMSSIDNNLSDTQEKIAVIISCGENCIPEMISDSTEITNDESEKALDTAQNPMLKDPSDKDNMSLFHRNEDKNV